MKSFRNIADDFASVNFAVKKVGQIIFLGVVILSYVKNFIFHFQYLKMKPSLDLELLYSDNVSYMYAVKTTHILR